VADRRWPAEIAHLPVCPKRGLPIPYIAEIAPDGTANFTILDHDRARECLERRLCAMCGRPMDGPVALLGDEVSLLPGGMFIEPPVHERCGEIALVDDGPRGWDRGVCPFLAGELVPRRPPDDNVAIIGMTAGELTEIGRTVAKRPMIMAITGTYRPVMAPSSDGRSAVMVYQPGPVERVRRFFYGPGGCLAEVPARAPVRVVRTPRRTQHKRGARRG
jgi:hypothetical protein